MAAKIILALCASALFVQSISACCGGNSGFGYSSSLGYGAAGLGNTGLGGCGSGVIASGGGLPVALASPIAPSGISLRSENGIEGPLCIEGALPVLSAVEFQGTLPTYGSAGVQYSCGNGNIGITSSGNGAGQSGAGLGYGAGIGSGLGGCGCGCGGFY